MKIWGLTFVLVGSITWAADDLIKSTEGTKVSTTNSGVQLTDDTNPDSLVACLKKIDFGYEPNSNNVAGGREQVNNVAVISCVENSVNFREKPSHADCMAAASRIKSNNNQKQKIYSFCNEHYFSTMSCVKVSYERKKRADSLEGNEKIEATAKLLESVDSCLEKKARYFTQDYCIEIL